MRTIFGIVFGAALAVGAAWLHDSNAKVDPLNPRVSDGQIVNWEVLGAVVRQSTDTITNLFHNATRK